MELKIKRGWKIVCLISISCIVMITALSFERNIDYTLKAETIEVDDSPAGEKIKDIGTACISQIFYALTENGQVYAWGRNYAGAFGNGQKSNNLDMTPQKVLNAESNKDGNKYLSNITKIYPSPSNGNIIALAEDGKIYGWGGNNQFYTTGFPVEIDCLLPIEIPLPDNLTAYDIKKIDMNKMYSVLLTNDGAVYVTGLNNQGTLGLGSTIKVAQGFTKVETDSDGNTLPKIVDSATTHYNSYLVSEDGYVYTSGDGECSGQGSATRSYTFSKAKFNSTTYVTGITKVLAYAYQSTVLFKAQDGSIYDVYDKDNNVKYYFAPLATRVFSDPYNVFKDTETFNFNNGSNKFIGPDNRIYKIDGFNANGILNERISTVAKYSEGDIPENYANAEKIIGGYNSEDEDLLLTKEGSVYFDGVKMKFGNIILSGKKSKDNSVYRSKEKYNDNVQITTSANDTSGLRYKEKDLLNDTTSEIRTGIPSIDININEDERVNKTYEFFLKDQESSTKVSFTVDLYKKEPVIENIEDGKKYQPGKSFTFSYNGFTENTLSAKLQKKDETATEYISGTEIHEVGIYDFIITDLYGNTKTYNFEITDKPIAESITFTKNPAGELIYANAITKANNQIGTISLVYPTGTTPSTIASATVKNEGDGVNFEIRNKNQLYVKTSDLTAKEYTLPIEGTDANGMPFSGEVTITIGKAAQTMAWDETSAKLATDGLALGDEVTLGVKDKLGNVDVTYGLKGEKTCITLTDNKVKVTCIPTPASVTFTATPSGNNNYTSDPIELTVAISKKAISLKTVIQDTDNTFKDNVSIHVGDTLPIVKVVDNEGNDVTELGTPTLTFKKNGTTYADPTIESGTYTVEASYLSGSKAENYTITWTSKATLTVSDITIDENNASDFYTLTSDGNPYTPNTWTNKPIMITPVHPEFSLMDVANANSPSATSYPYSVEGAKEVNLTFSTPDGAKVSTKVKLNYDKTEPVMTSFTYDDVNAPVRAFFRSLFSFTHYFDKEKALKFVGNDEETGSGIKEYQYEIVEVNADGSEITGTKKVGTLDQVNSVKLEMNKNYKITAKVVDNAGNVSEPMSETVQLNDEIGELQLSATSDGKPYDGFKWTSKEITITLTGTNKSGVTKYQYSTDGTTFTDFTSSDGMITLPSPLENIDNKTYTFRAVNNDGTTNDKTLVMKVDKDKPVVKVKGMVGSTIYDGSETDQDVTIIPYQETESISGITYYYTDVEGSEDSDPLTDTNWKKYTGVVSENRNGTHTYYIKGISGAGLVSDTESITIKIAKKEYTKVEVTATSEGNPYTSGTWAKHDVTFTLNGGLTDEEIITGYEYTTTSDGSRPSASATWTTINGDKQHEVTANSSETYWFRVLPLDPNGSISKGTLINLDVDKPTKPTFTIEEVNTDPVARFINLLSFGEWMKSGVKITINSDDETSGLDHFTYEEITSNGRIEKQTQSGILLYEDETNIKLQAKAYDKAGNVSEVSDESGSIQIDTTPPEIQGVKDQDVYKKYYYVYRTITYTDTPLGAQSDGSGIDDDNALIKHNDTTTALTQGYKVKEIGKYEVNVSDIAGNKTTVHFELVPLPDIEIEIDGSDESKDIIDQVQKELDEEREHLTPDEIKDYEKWIEDAHEKWENERSKVLEDEDTGTKIEGEGETSFDPNTVLVVDEIDENKIPTLPRKAIYVYDVYMKKGETVVQPDGSVKVYLPYDEKEEPIIYEIDEDGNVKEIKGTKENGYVTFITDSLEKYAISNEAQEENKKPEDNTCTAGPDGELGTKDDVCGNGSSSEEPIKKPDGSVEVPNDGSITFPNGNEIETPDGGIIHPDGSVTLPDGTEYDKDGNKKPKDPKPNPDDTNPPPDEKPKVCDIKNGVILNKDTDGDGLPDINLDIDNDCYAELNIDIDKNGIPDLDIDTDGDGKADINIDVNGDGYANLNVLKLTEWKPDKDDCEYQGFKYDTMSNLKPDSNIDTDGDGKADTNITNQTGNANNNSVQGNYNKNTTNGVGGAGTGDSTKWYIWMIVMALTLVTLFVHLYRNHKKKA